MAKQLRLSLHCAMSRANKQKDETLENRNFGYITRRAVLTQTVKNILHKLIKVLLFKQFFKLLF